MGALCGEAASVINRCVCGALPATNVAKQYLHGACVNLARFICTLPAVRGWGRSCVRATPSQFPSKSRASPAHVPRKSRTSNSAHFPRRPNPAHFPHTSRTALRNMHKQCMLLRSPSEGLPCY